VEYTNGEKTGLNKYVTKVSQKITVRSLEVQNGVQKGQKWNREWVVTVKGFWDQNWYPELSGWS